MKTFLRSFALIVALLGISVSLSAQITTASIGGTVTDGKNEPLAGATVKATHVPSGTVYYVSSQVTENSTSPVCVSEGPTLLKSRSSVSIPKG